MDRASDPLWRFVIAGCLGAVALGSSSTLWLAFAAGGCLWWTLASAMPAAHLVRRIKKTAFFLLVIIATSGLSGNGRVFFHEGGLYLTQEGVEGGILQSVRLLLAVWSATLFVWTTQLEEILDVAEGFMTRKGRPVLAAGIIALNYLPVFVQSARRMAIARRARGEAESRWPVSGVSRVARSALPLFAAALRDADVLADAMESRCFDPLAPRSRWKAAGRSRPGLIAATGSAMLLTAAILGFL